LVAARRIYIELKDKLCCLLTDALWLKGSIVPLLLLTLVFCALYIQRFAVFVVANNE